MIAPDQWMIMHAKWRVSIHMNMLANPRSVLNLINNQSKLEDIRGNGCATSEDEVVAWRVYDLLIHECKETGTLIEKYSLMNDIYAESEEHFVNPGFSSTSHQQNGGQCGYFPLVQWKDSHGEKRDCGWSRYEKRISSLVESISWKINSFL